MQDGKFKAASIQFEPTLGSKEHNVRTLLRMVEEAATAGASLIVTPEMGTTGYCWFDRAEVSPQVETVPGATTQAFETLARLHRCFIVIGLPEVDAASGLYYNTAVLIGPGGIVGKHRKTHPYISEPKWAAPGDSTHAVFDTSIGRIGLLICMDIHFIETARIEGLQGADVICHISNWLAERAPAPYWISRAVENGCYVIESNRWGLERTVQFSGGTCVIEPDGNVAAVIDGGDGICFAEIDTARSRRREVFGEPVFGQRRPELYKDLMNNNFLWNPSDFFRLYGHRPMASGQRSKVSVAQMAPGNDVQANLSRILELARLARARDGSSLVVFPELALTGHGDPASGALDTAAPAVDALQACALELGLHIAVGLAERDAGKFYNSAVLVGPQGLIARHRKLHLTTADRRWATAGNDWTVCDLPVGRVGLMIGHDASFPESGRVLALMGCDLIACPSHQQAPFVGGHAGSAVGQNYPIPTGRDPLHWHFFRTRAGENNVYFAFANSVERGAGGDGKTGKGGFSGVFGPDTYEFPRQEAIVLADEGVATSAMDTTSHGESRYPTNVVRRKDLVMMRLPHHYKPLVVEPTPQRADAAVL